MAVNLKTGRIRFILTTTHLLMMYPDFQYISFHEQSDRVSFLEGKVFQDGWIFLPFSFFTENWKVFITSILMKTAKDFEIIRGDIHIRICKHPYPRL